MHLMLEMDNQEYAFYLGIWCQEVGPISKMYASPNVVLPMKLDPYDYIPVPKYDAHQGGRGQIGPILKSEMPTNTLNL